jgi:hypothetical protein
MIANLTQLFDRSALALVAALPIAAAMFMNLGI